MFDAIKKYIERLLLKEKSPEKLAASFSAGTFIALSPTIPFQTPLIFLVSWLFRLNTAVTFSAVYLVNNPLTMVPIYMIAYAVGHWFFESLLGISLVPYNPQWVDHANQFIAKYFDITKYLGSKFCLWYLLFGGLLFAGVVSIALYPLLKIIFKRFVARLEKKK